MRLILPVCLLILVSPALSQDLTGFWKGSLTMLGCFPNNNIELQISFSGNEAWGDSYHYQDVNNYVKKKFRGSFNKLSQKLVIQEGSVTTYHIPYNCHICIKNFDLVYSKSGNLETLEGVWNGKIKDTRKDCSEGKIILTRIKESAFKGVPEIKVDTGEIRLDFYDNAYVDGDSITLLVNKKVILSHQRLSAKPITAYLRVDPGNSFFEIEMVAENLGSIPPNTAIVIINAGKQNYRLFLSSSESKSAMVRFVYDPDVGLPDKSMR
jgi:hypothetical protein